MAAGPARAWWCKRLRRKSRSRVVWQQKRCCARWRWPNSLGICRCIAKRRFLPVRALILIARRLLFGWVERRGGSNHSISCCSRKFCYPRVFCDETPVPVLDPGRGRTKTGQFWTYAVDDRPWCGPAPPAVAYVYTEDRKGKRVNEQLQGFSGVLQVDGYAGYNGLTKANRPGGPVTLALCNAHARRKFYEIHKSQ